MVRKFFEHEFGKQTDAVFLPRYSVRLIIRSTFLEIGICQSRKVHSIHNSRDLRNRNRHEFQTSSSSGF